MNVIYTRLSVDGKRLESYACALTAACEEAEAKVANITAIEVASITVAKAKHQGSGTSQWQNCGWSRMHIRCGQSCALLAPLGSF